MSRHPAPWPLLNLDVAAMRGAGHQPVPFQQFILKVHSRCNLSCSYCYVYEMADQGWRHMPKRMTRPMAAKVIERVAEHARQHDLPGVEIILHGGEPLLAGSAWLAELSGSLRTHVPTPVNIGVQTNGTLLRPPLLDVLKDLGIRVGVSLDGDAEATGRNRAYANGRNSFEDVAEGLYLLDSPEYRDIYSGILCTVDVRNDPVATYEALLKFNPPAVDLLLPHANWSCPPPGSGYADWLIAIFERWYSAPVAGDPDSYLRRADPAHPGPARRGGGARPAAEHPHRRRNGRCHQAARFAELGLSRRRRHRAAYPHRFLRCGPRPSHHCC